MDPAEHRRLAVKGGQMAQKTGKAHRWTTEEAKAAGRKGGLCTWDNRRKVKTENPAA